MSPSVADIETAFRAVLASPYLSDMSQYGFEQLESLEFAFVNGSDPPSPTYVGEDATDLVSALIDSGSFPEPDKPGGRIIYMVLPHRGTAYTGADIEAAGGHADETIFDSPVDWEFAWVAWVNFDQFIDAMTSVFTHELVETISDPEIDAWRNGGALRSEIGDICYPNNGPVSDYAAAAYYSRRLNTCVVPSNGLRRRVLVQSMVEEPFGTIFETTGLTAADSGHRCFSGYYHWTLLSQAHRTTLTLDVSSYVNPEVTWSVNGQRISPGGTEIDFPVDNTYDPIAEFAPSKLHAQMATLRFEPKFLEPIIVITCPADAGVVEPTIQCTVTDSGFLGYDTKRTISVPLLTAGRTRSMDARLKHDRESCFLGSLTELNQIVAQILPFIDQGDPVPIWVEHSILAMLNNLHAALAEGERLSRWTGASSISSIGSRSKSGGG